MPAHPVGILPLRCPSMIKADSPGNLTLNAASPNSKVTTYKLHQVLWVVCLFVSRDSQPNETYTRIIPWSYNAFNKLTSLHAQNLVWII